MTPTTPMLPRSIKLKKFRCFEDEQELPIRRLTLLYGENNTGKSALVRLLPIIADSCDPRATAPLASRSDALRKASSRSLFWREGRELELEFVWDDFSARYVISIDGIDAQRAVIERCTITAEGRLIAEARLASSRREGPSHDWIVAGATVDSGGFGGFVPGGWAAMPHSVGSVLRERMERLHGAVQWLHARRAPLPRSTTAIDDPFWYLKPDGSDVIELLSSQPEVVWRVGDWFGRHLGLLFDVSRPVRSSDASLVLRTPDGYGTNMVDGSEGLQFVVSPLAALGALHARSPVGPSLLVLEEPEGHLHGRLQRALAEEIIDVVERTPDARVVIETHSPIFLTAIQLAIVTARDRAGRSASETDDRRALKSEDVAVCLVEREGNASYIRHLDLDDDGAPQTSALMDFFSEEHAIAQDLLKARRRR